MQQAQRLLLFNQTVHGWLLSFASFDPLLLSIFFSNLARLVLLNIFG